MLTYDLPMFNICIDFGEFTEEFTSNLTLTQTAGAALHRLRYYPGSYWIGISRNGRRVAILEKDQFGITVIAGASGHYVNPQWFINRYTEKLGRR